MSSLPSNMRVGPGTTMTDVRWSADVEIPSIPIVLHWTCRPGVPSRSHLLWFAVQRSGAWCTGLVDAPFHKSFLKILLAEMIQSYSASNLYVSPLAATETNRTCWVVLVATWTRLVLSSASSTRYSIHRLCRWCSFKLRSSSVRLIF